MSSIDPPDILSALPVVAQEENIIKFYSFDLPDTSPIVQVSFARDLDKRFSREALLDYKAFKEWLTTLRSSLDLQRKTDMKPLHPFHEDPYTLKKIHIQSVDYFRRRIGFLKFEAIIENTKGAALALPGKIFMRGGSVAMLMILRPNDSHDERWVIMTQQPRVPAGSLAFVEIPAGMIDAGTFSGAAAKEIQEETGMTIEESELVDMTKLALEGSPNPENLKAAMYPSPGGSDEFIVLFLWEKTMERLEIEAHKDKLMGVRKEAEQITVKLLKYEDLWRVATRDAKTMASWALYESLKRAGKLDENGKVVRGTNSDLG